jgi:hypothetical protein
MSYAGVYGGLLMIDLLGFLYDVAKDIKEYYEWGEEEKLVDFDWPEKSGLMAKAEAAGMSVRWCRPDKIASRQLSGYEILYEIDTKNRIRRRLVLKDGLVLLGIRSNA